MNDRRPLYTAAVVIIVGGILALLWFGQAIVLPLLFAGLFAFLLHPVDEYFRSLTGTKWVGLVASTLLLLAVLGGLLSVLGWQISTVAEDTDRIRREITQTEEELQNFVSDRLGFTNQQIERNLDKLLAQTNSAATSFLGNLSGTLGNILLTLVYFVLFLFQKRRFREFFYRVYPRDHQPSGRYLLDQTNHIARRYFVGKLFVMVVLGAAYWLGFWLIGLRFAALIGILAALLSIIPYLGNLVGGSIAILVAIVFGSPTDALYVIGVMTLAQVVESYVLTPLIIGDEVGLNPWATVLSIVVLGAFWGAGGAIIALPLMGILNEFFKAHSATRHLGFLLGQEEISAP